MWLVFIVGSAHYVKKTHHRRVFRDVTDALRCVSNNMSVVRSYYRRASTRVCSIPTRVCDYVSDRR